MRWLRLLFKPYSLVATDPETFRYVDETGRVAIVTGTWHSSDLSIRWIDDLNLKFWCAPNKIAMTPQERELVLCRVLKAFGPQAKRLSSFPGDVRSEFDRGIEKAVQMGLRVDVQEKSANNGELK
jgi:hypothetical protein